MKSDCLKNPNLTPLWRSLMEPFSIPPPPPWVERGYGISTFPDQDYWTPRLRIGVIGVCQICAHASLSLILDQNRSHQR